MSSNKRKQDSYTKIDEFHEKVIFREYHYRETRFIDTIFFVWVTSRLDVFLQYPL